MLDRLRRVFKRGREEFPDLPDVTLHPVGYVKNNIKQPMPDGWANIESRIVVKPELEPMLLNLADYSHVIVVFWPHLVPDDVRGATPQIHPRGDPQYPLMGLFATRSQTRPNPVLTTPVRLLGIKTNVLKVRGLDAINGTPVLDLKPYFPFFDRVDDARIPEWVEKAQDWREPKP